VGCIHIAQDGSLVVSSRISVDEQSSVLKVKNILICFSTKHQLPAVKLNLNQLKAKNILLIVSPMFCAYIFNNSLQ
jgi:hypothetical protein